MLRDTILASSSNSPVPPSRDLKERSALYRANSCDFRLPLAVVVEMKAYGDY